MSDVETDLLETSGHRKVESRLSCQLRMDVATNNLRVTIAPEE
jgi:2Fe-2S ferredoxin